MLPNVGSNDLAVLSAGMGQDVLNKVIAILIAGNVDEWNARAVATPLADTIEVSAEELWTTNLEALFDDLRGKLIGAVLGSVANDVVDSSAAIRRSAMLADVLNAPVSKLTVGNNVDVGEDFFNAWSLYESVSKRRFRGEWRGNKTRLGFVPCLPQDNSQKYSERPGFQSHQAQPHATCHAKRHLRNA